MSNENAITHADFLWIIGARPGITKIELCDRLELDLEEVEDNVHELLSQHAIRTHMMKGANGVPCVGLTLPNAQLPTIFERKLEEIAAAPAVKSDKPISKVDKAIAFMQANGGTATSAELSTIMELRPDQYPSAWLSEACRNGRINKDGTNWALGAGKKIKEIDPMKPFTVVAQRDDTPPAQFDMKTHGELDIADKLISDLAAALDAETTMVEKAINNPPTHYSGLRPETLHVKQSEPTQASDQSGVNRWYGVEEDDEPNPFGDVKIPPTRQDADFDLEKFKKAWIENNNPPQSELQNLDWKIVNQGPLRPKSVDFAIWSGNGELHIADAERTLMCLTRDQVIAMMDYLAVFDVTRREHNFE
jgi:hypothetical protein